MPGGIETQYSQSMQFGQLDGYPGLVNVLLAELKLPHPVKEKICINSSLHLKETNKSFILQINVNFTTLYQTLSSPRGTKARFGNKVQRKKFSPRFENTTFDSIIIQIFHEVMSSIAIPHYSSPLLSNDSVDSEQPSTVRLLTSWRPLLCVFAMSVKRI